jgi:hypothetical protein
MKGKHKYHKPLKAYISLIRERQANPLVDTPGELHHTFPKSIFRSKENRKTKENPMVILLSYHEHFEAHQLLVDVCKARYGDKHWKTRCMLNALGAMMMTNGGKRILTPDEYSICRKASVEAKIGNKFSIGRKVSCETKFKISEVKKKANKLRIESGAPHHSSLEILEVFSEKVYESAASAARELGISQALINLCCLGKKPQAAGKLFVFSNSTHEHIQIRKDMFLNRPKNGDYQKRKVISSDSRIYESSSEAFRITGINRGNINACCRGEIKNAGKLSWQFYNNQPTYTPDVNNQYSLFPDQISA